MTMFTQRETRILDQARDIISRYYQRGVQLCSPNDVRRCVMVELAPLHFEVETIKVIESIEFFFRLSSAALRISEHSESLSISYTAIVLT